MDNLQAIQNKTLIYIGGIGQEITSELIHAAFIPFGDILEVQIPLDNSNIPRGFAFVNYEDRNYAKDAIDNMHLSEINGKVLKVSIARPTKLNESSSHRAIWDEDDWLKNQHIEVPDVVEESLQKKQKISEKGNCFFEISISGANAGRIEFKLFHDIVPSIYL